MATAEQVRQSALRCAQQIRDLGYTVPGGIKYSLSTRMHRALGKCIEKRYMGEVISLEIRINAEVPERILDQVMMHELVHAVVGGRAKHGPLFQKMANIVNRNYGYKVSTYASTEESNALSEVRKDNGGPEIHCLQCNKTYHVTRRHGVFKNVSGYRCKCGGKLEIL